MYNKYMIRFLLTIMILFSGPSFAMMDNTATFNPEAEIVPPVERAALEFTGSEELNYSAWEKTCCVVRFYKTNGRLHPNCFPMIDAGEITQESCEQYKDVIKNANR